MKGARAFALVIAAPSGAGKTSLAQELVRRHDDVVFSISATTRAPRDYERDGVDYHFVSDAEFSRLAETEELLEWAVVHGCRYGTLRREVTAACERGQTVVLDIDVQGARQVRERLPGAVLTFILPPSMPELVRRLAQRASETPAQVATRMASAIAELESFEEFDYVVVNDVLETAVAELEAIITAESCRVSRGAVLIETAADMLGELRSMVQRSQ